ncbi:rolling circle replication-associated protein [Rhodobacter capsulatus]
MNDYVARALAEASVSAVTATVTLTYAPRDDLADKVLHPRHFQLFMKLLRRAGHKVRYLVAGEYGDLRGRAHFHALLFQHLLPLERYRCSDGQVYDLPPDQFSDLSVIDRVQRGLPAVYNPGHLFDPQTSQPFSRQIPQKRMVHIREWPHGHIKVDWSASEKSARYVCKYLLSDNKNNAWFSLSKKPALGAAWFARKAALARELGVLPSSFEYLPPGGSRNKTYLMTGATRRDYLDAITQDDADREKCRSGSRRLSIRPSFAACAIASKRFLLFIRSKLSTAFLMLLKSKRLV